MQTEELEQSRQLVRAEEQRGQLWLRESRKYVLFSQDVQTEELEQAIQLAINKEHYEHELLVLLRAKVSFWQEVQRV